MNEGGIMSFSIFQEWGLQSDVILRFGARLVQEGNLLHYLVDRAGLRGNFNPEPLQKIDQTFSPL